MEITEERRSENRQIAKDCYSAEIRIVGVPVYEVKLFDLSSRGASIILKNSSSLLNHLQIGQNLLTKYFFEDRSKPSEMFRAQVKHISEVKGGRFKGYYSAGLSILYTQAGYHTY
jgi:hypothetical protein